MSFLLDSPGIKFGTAGSLRVDAPSAPAVTYPTDGLVFRIFADEGLSTSGSDILSMTDQSGSLLLEPVTNSPTVGTAPSGDEAIVFGTESGMREAGIGSLPTGADDFSMVLVWQPTPGAGAYGGLAYGTFSAGQSRGIIMNQSDQIVADWAGTGNTITGNTADGSAYCTMLIYESGTLTLYNGTSSVGSATPTLATGSSFVNLMRSYSGNTTHGKVFGAFIYDKALDATERTAIYTFGNAKWIADTSNPTIASVSPTDNATDVSIGVTPAATFDKFVTLETGNVVLRANDGGWADLETFNVATGTGDNGGTVSVTNDVLTITPGAVLANSIEHAIRIDATAIDDLVGNSFAGISDDTTWSFTSEAADVTAPTLASSSPSDNATGVAVGSSIDLIFDEQVTLETGNILLRDNDGGFATLETFNVATGTGDGGGTVSLVTTTVTNDTVRINPGTSMAYEIEHAVQVGATCIDDLAGNSFAGISDDTTVSWTTGAAPEASSYDPSIYQPADYTCDTLAEMMSAISSATAGETIQLNDGFVAATKPEITKNNAGPADIVIFAESFRGALFNAGIDIEDGTNRLHFTGIDVHGGIRIDGSSSGSSNLSFTFGRCYKKLPEEVNDYTDLDGSLGFDICYTFTGSVTDGLIQDWELQGLGGGGIDFDAGSDRWVVNRMTANDLGTDMIQSLVTGTLLIANCTMIGRNWGAPSGHVDWIQQFSSINQLYWIGNVRIITGGNKQNDQAVFIDTDVTATKLVVEHNVNFNNVIHNLVKFDDGGSCGSTSRIRWNTYLSCNDGTGTFDTDDYTDISFSNASTTAPNVYAPASRHGLGDTKDGSGRILLDYSTDEADILSQMGTYFESPPTTLEKPPTNGGTINYNLDQFLLKTAHATSGSDRPNGFIDITPYLAEAGLS